MSAEARAWLAERADGVPHALQARMDAGVDAADGATTHDVLAAAALVALEEALALCDDRAAALPLLAADALITAACEAAADNDVALTALCAAFHPARLAGIVEQAPQ